MTQPVSKPKRTLMAVFVQVAGALGATVSSIWGLLIWFVSEDDRSTKAVKATLCFLVFVLSVLLQVWLGLREPRSD